MMAAEPSAGHASPPTLTVAYEETWREWSDSGDESLWDAVMGDWIA